jgi:hypothetical protein
MMSIHEAWARLGKDANLIVNEVSKLPRSERSAALDKLTDEAKRLARPLLAKYHPDKGGDVSNFRVIQDSVTAIVNHTNEFKKRVSEITKRSASIASRRPVVIDVDRPK